LYHSGVLKPLISGFFFAEQPLRRVVVPRRGLDVPFPKLLISLASLVVPECLCVPVVCLKCKPILRPGLDRGDGLRVAFHGPVAVFARGDIDKSDTLRAWHAFTEAQVLDGSIETPKALKAE
jgi:hypothetical protein